MNKSFYFLAFLALNQTFESFTLRAQYRNHPFGLAVEMKAGYSLVAKDGFQDPEPRYGIAYGWLNQVKSGTTLAGKIIFYLPYGFRLYTGYHFGNFPEQSADASLWTRVYQQDFHNHFILRDYNIKNRTRGFSAGLAYAPHWFQGRIHPYVFGERRTEKLRSTTRLDGEADQFWSIFGLRSGTFTGSSIMETETATGFGAGLGAEIIWGRIIFVPAWQYVYISAQIIERKLEYTIYPHEGNVLFSKTTGDLDILEGQKIDLRYSTFCLGLRFIIF